jgi:hypothetical protein
MVVIGSESEFLCMMQPVLDDTNLNIQITKPNIPRCRRGCHHYFKLHFGSRRKIPRPFSSEGEYAYSWPFLDVFLMEKTPQGYQIPIEFNMREYHGTPFVYREQDLLPVQKLEFDGVQIATVARPEVLLAQMFGPRWGEECDSGGWDHRHETPKPKQARQRVPCTDVRIN